MSEECLRTTTGQAKNGCHDQNRIPAQPSFLSSPTVRPAQQSYTWSVFKLTSPPGIWYLHRGSSQQSSSASLHYRRRCRWPKLFTANRCCLGISEPSSYVYRVRRIGHCPRDGLYYYYLRCVHDDSRFRQPAHIAITSLSVTKGMVLQTRHDGG